jgi:ABC-2 type transport system permease protein
MRDSLRNMQAMIELELRRIKHDRTELYTRAVQPVLWLAIYGTIMSRVKAIPTGEIPYIDYIALGVLMQSVIMLSIFYGLIMVWERESGILKKLYVTPASRYATIIGRSMAAGVRAIFQALIIIPIALLLGVKFLPNPLYFALALLIVFFISGGFAALSIFMASFMKTRERFMGIGQAIVMPLFFASNALYPIAMMPPIVHYFAIFNPLSYAVDAVRSLMISGDSTNLLLDIGAIAVFDAIMFVGASLSFRKIIE